MTNQKLNSTVALAKILGQTPESVQLAEESETLTEMVNKFNDSNKVFSLSELSDYTKNTQTNQIKSIIEHDNIPSELYNKVKGTVMEQAERNFKREHDYTGDYDDFTGLINNIISDKSKQPNESKKEDLIKISDLESRLNDVGKTMQLNEQFRTQILQHEETLNQKTGEITQKYQSQILKDRMDRIIEKVPFADGDNDFTRELLKDGFINKLKKSTEFKFNETDDIVSYNRETGSLITNKVDGFQPFEKVIEQSVIDFNVPIKQIKEGDNITSTSYQQNGGINNIQDAQKYIEDNQIFGHQAQSEVFAKIPVKQ